MKPRDLIWIFIILVHFAPMEMLFSGLEPDGSGDAIPYYRYIKYATSLYALAFLFSKSKYIFPWLKSAWPFLLYYFAAGLSTILSEDIQWSTVQFLALTTTVVTALAVTFRYSQKQLITVIMQVLLICMILSFVSILLIPDYGIEIAGLRVGRVGSGFWRGVFISKNIFGHACALSFVLLYLYGYSFIRVQILRVMLMGLTLLLLFKSHCTTGIVIILFCLIVDYIRKKHDLVKKYRTLIIFCVLAILPFIGWIAARLVALTGKNLTLSGRTEIWTYGIKMISNHLLTGFGYYYTTSPPVMEMIYKRFGVTHFHNCYLETLINSGLITLIPLLIMMTLAIKKTYFFQIDEKNNIASRFVITLIIFWTLSGIVEPHALRPFGFISFIGFVALFTHYRNQMVVNTAQSPTIN